MLGLIKKFKIKKLKEERNNLELQKKLIDAYIKIGIIPRKKRPDAAHIASATWHQLGLLVSWNCKLIVRPELQEKIKAVNILNGYEELKLATPLEVIHYEE